MKDKIILIIKGFILGIANIIPGVSGGTLAITLGIYEELINTISHFFGNIKKNINFIIPIGIGAILSILTMSKLLNYTLENYPLPTTLFFMGLIVGGIPLIAKKVIYEKRKITYVGSFMLTFLLVIFLTFAKNGLSAVNLNTLNFGMFLILFIVGIIAAATMVVPGISGSFVLMLIGFYEPILDTISSMTNMSLLAHNISILLPFGIGVVIGIILVAKLIEYLLKKYEIITYYAILGFIISSIIVLFMGLFNNQSNLVQLLIGVILFIVGSIIGYKLGDE